MKKILSLVLITIISTFLLSCVSCDDDTTKTAIKDWENMIDEDDDIINEDPKDPTDEASEPFFNIRGIVARWSDVSNPSKIDYIQIAKENGINTFSIHGADRNSLVWKNFAKKCAEANIDLEYQEHMLAYVLPRELFNKHPEYFRMNKNGVRVNDANGCPSSKGALEEIYKNAKSIGLEYEPTNNRYYFWLDDGGDICYCDQCKNYNASDQALIFENEIIKALKEINPDALLAHLCYHNTVDAPSIIRPSDDIFLEFAPFTRSWNAPLSQTWAKSPRSSLTHGDYLKALKENLKIFPVETAQVLEYWLDVSLFSGWNPSELVEAPWSNEIFQNDINTYASLGIKNITCYTAYIGPDYVNKFGDVSFLAEYGQGLLKYRLKK